MAQKISVKRTLLAGELLFVNGRESARLLMNAKFAVCLLGVCSSEQAPFVVFYSYLGETCLFIVSQS